MNRRGRDNAWGLQQDTEDKREARDPAYSGFRGPSTNHQSEHRMIAVSPSFQGHGWRAFQRDDGSHGGRYVS